MTNLKIELAKLQMENTGKLTIKNVSIGDRFKYDNQHISEVVDFIEQKSMITGEIVGYVCLAIGVGTLATNTFETAFATVVRNRVQPEADRIVVNNPKNTTISDIAKAYGVDVEALQDFVEKTLWRKVLDGEEVSDLFADQELAWKVKGEKEQLLMNDLIPILKQRANGREIAGLILWKK